ETAHTVRGLGLGLAIVERIGKVLEHGIDMQSVPGRGSMFAVELPQAKPKPAAEIAAAAPPAAGSIAGLNVLCIDNEPDVLDGMQILLDGWGCTTIGAQSAAEAEDRLRAAGVKPDIILADFHLDGGTGLEAVATL